MSFVVVVQWFHNINTDTNNNNNTKSARYSSASERSEGSAFASLPRAVVHVNCAA